jgi:hypothetical protein
MPEFEQAGRRSRLIPLALAALLVVAGALLLVVGFRSQQQPPQPPASAVVQAPASTAPVPAPPTTAGAGNPAGQQLPTGQGPLLPASSPTHLDVPAIGVSSDLVQLGLQPDNTVEVPPLAKASRAGWYRGSPTPGELGPAVILGHVDSVEYGPAVFFELGALRPSDRITVTRSDHTAAVFSVDRVVSYPKDSFPTLEVYGNTDHAALRLITCGGQFDPSSHNYLDNIVVYATLTDSHPE